MGYTTVNWCRISRINHTSTFQIVSWELLHFSLWGPPVSRWNRVFHIDDLPSGQNRSTEEAQIGGAHQFDSFQGGKIWNWKGVMEKR